MIRIENRKTQIVEKYDVIERDAEGKPTKMNPVFFDYFELIKYHLFSSQDVRQSMSYNIHKSISNINSAISNAKTDGDITYIEIADADLTVIKNALAKGFPLVNSITSEQWISFYDYIMSLK